MIYGYTSNYKVFYFDDVLKDTPFINYVTNEEALAKVITDLQANDLVKFIVENINKYFIVHCWAGISRSAAVGTFIHELQMKNDLSLTWDLFHSTYTEIDPNPVVLNKLRTCYQNSYLNK